MLSKEFEYATDGELSETFKLLDTIGRMLVGLISHATIVTTHN